MILGVQGDCTSTFSYIEKSRFSAEATEGEETEAWRAVGEGRESFKSRLWKLLKDGASLAIKDVEREKVIEIQSTWENL